MATLRRSYLGMQEERGGGDAERGKRQGSRWWEENDKLKCALPWGSSDPQIEGMLSGMHSPLTPLEEVVRRAYVSYSIMMRLHSKGGRDAGTEAERAYGAAEEWLPSVELRDESRTGILFCQLECANGNVRAAGKLMNLIGEMPPLSPYAWSIAIVFFGRWCFLLFFDCFPLPGQGCLQLRVSWWTLSQGNKGIDLGAGINAFICYLQVRACEKVILD